MIKKIIIAAAIICVLAIGVTYLLFTFTYSEGSRAGLLIKFSHKGYIFKTYEGELNLVGINSSSPLPTPNNIWQFSVSDKNAAYKLMSLEGKYVRVHYKQKMKTLSWMGETDYFVDNVEVIK